MDSSPREKFFNSSAVLISTVPWEKEKVVKTSVRKPRLRGANSTGINEEGGKEL